MNRIFANAKIAVLFAVVSIFIGVLLAFVMGQKPDNKLDTIAFGFIAFSVLPISLCLFGLKELIGVFMSIAQYLKKTERDRLREYVDNRCKCVIYLAFFIVALQVFSSFLLLYAVNGFEYLILGVLFGGALYSLFYGIFVCYTVKNISACSDEIISKRISEENVEKYINSFK